MSDIATPDKPPPGDPELSEENLDEFIKEKWLSPDCPRCGVAKWGIDLVTKGVANIPFSTPPIFISFPTRIIPFYTLYCLNCGHSEFVMRHIFLEWAHRPKEGGP